MNDKNRNRLLGILILATMEGHSLNTRLDVEKLADYLLSEGITLNEIEEG